MKYYILTDVGLPLMGEGRDRDRMKRFVSRMKKRGYLPPDAPAVETMVEEADA